ncbi:MAG: T9SS type A sorting domain-containing protein [Bacteroidota bacterium]
MKHLLFLLLVATASANYAQSGTLSAGGDIDASDGNVAYSIGQPFFQYSIALEGDVNEGLQQPIELFSLDVIAVSVSGNASVAPNPFTDFIQLTFSTSEQIDYAVYDAFGRLVRKGSVNDLVSQLDLSDLSRGNYLLQLSNNHVFHLIKD